MKVLDSNSIYNSIVSNKDAISSDGSSKVLEPDVSNEREIMKDETPNKKSFCNNSEYTTIKIA